MIVYLGGIFFDISRTVCIGWAHGIAHAELLLESLFPHVTRTFVTFAAYATLNTDFAEHVMKPHKI